MVRFWVNLRMNAGRPVVKAVLKAAVIGLLLSGLPARSSAQVTNSLESVQSQLSDLDRFPLFLPASRGTLVAASNQLSPLQMSQPSLVWIQDQLGDRYGSDRLIGQWQAYQIPNGPNYVDVVVNEPIWNLLNYFERYAFILKFGTAAKDYGYHLRVFHSGDALNSIEIPVGSTATRRPARVNQARFVVLRGAYFCGFGERLQQPDAIATTPCKVALDESSRRPPLNRPF
ncbi:MAG: hypothetical protein WBB01_04860 [Phormidesmis sp.]